MKGKWIITIRRDRFLLAWGIGGLILGALMIYYMRTTPWAIKQYSSVIKSPTFFPYIGIYGLIIMSAIVVVTAIGQGQAIRKNNTNAPAFVTFNIYGIAMILVWVGFMALNKPIGFVPASIICILLTEWLCGVNMKKPMPYVIAIVTPLLFYFVFGRLLKVRFSPVPFLK